MSECFWNDADAELKAYFEQRMGTGGLYPDLQAAQVVVVAFRDTAQWDKWANDSVLPAIIIMGVDCRLTTDEHGQPMLSLGKTYEYVTVAILEGTQEAAIQGSKTMARRIERAIAAKRSIEAVAEDGERCHQILPGMSFVSIAQRRTSDPDRWFGIGGFNYFIQTAG